MEHRHDQHVSEDRMAPSYLEGEKAFREAAGKLWAEEEALRGHLRSDANLSSEERQDIYRARYGELERRFEGLAEKFSGDVSRGVVEAQQTLNAGVGAKFAEHLTAVSGIRDEMLGEIMATARRSGQADLERAVALTAYERGVRGVWRSRAESNPERAEAVKLIREVPGAVQFSNRVRTMRPPRADVRDIEPTAADVQEARKASDAAAAARQAFFRAKASSPRRQVGGRIS